MNSPKLRHIALFTPAWEGHQPTFCKLLSNALLDLRHRVTVYCPEPQALADVCSHGGDLQVVRYSPPGARGNSRVENVMRALQLWRGAATAIRSARAGRPDLTFFAWLDDQLVPGLVPALVERLFPSPWSGLYFHAQATRPRTPLLAAHAALGSRHCGTVGMLEEQDASRVQECVRKPVTVFPEVTEESLSAAPGELEKEIVKRASGRKIVGLVGSLEARKGLFTLMSAAEAAVHEPLYFVFAGQLADAGSGHGAEWARFHGMAARKPDNCFFHLKRIPDERQFNSVVHACDVLFAAYWDFASSSNLLSKAAVFAKPIIVSEGHCMARRVREHAMGAVIPQRDAAACLKAVRALLQHGMDGAGYRRYREIHSFERLATAFERVIALSPEAR